MDLPSYRFDGFILDTGNRQLRRGDTLVELNARYLDALALLLREQGRLVTKEHFLDEVWRGVPVTDEALTQCIRTLRRQLGDDAARPRFIETVPKHGYRFVATLDAGEQDASKVTDVVPETAWRRVALLGGAGTAGAGLAGALGGLFYGFAGAAQPLQPGTGAASVLIILFCVTLLMAVIGGAGVSFGIAAARLLPNRAWIIVGGALGGLVVGGVVKLLGLDAISLLFGQSPGNITGAGEGALLGGTVGLGMWASRASSLRRSVGIAALAGGVTGMVIPMIGGRLLGGSLALLAGQFPNSRLRLEPIGALFGESGFGPISQAVTGGIEGALFGGCIVGAMLIVPRVNARGSPAPR